jgi:hypothetical protein
MLTGCLIIGVTARANGDNRKICQYLSDAAPAAPATFLVTANRRHLNRKQGIARKGLGGAKNLISLHFPHRRTVFARVSFQSSIVTVLGRWRQFWDCADPSLCRLCRCGEHECRPNHRLSVIVVAKTWSCLF